MVNFKICPCKSFRIKFDRSWMNNSKVPVFFFAAVKAFKTFKGNNFYLDLLEVKSNFHQYWGFFEPCSCWEVTDIYIRKIDLRRFEMKINYGCRIIDHWFFMLCKACFPWHKLIHNSISEPTWNDAESNEQDPFQTSD